MTDGANAGKSLFYLAAENGSHKCLQVLIDAYPQKEVLKPSKHPHIL
jgi:hypothetical protein